MRRIFRATLGLLVVAAVAVCECPRPWSPCEGQVVMCASQLQTDTGSVFRSRLACVGRELEAVVDHICRQVLGIADALQALAVPEAADPSCPGG